MNTRNYSIRRTSVKKPNIRLIVTIAAIAGAVAVVLCLVFLTNVFKDKSSSLMITEEVISETCEGNSSGIISLSDDRMLMTDCEGFLMWSAEKDAAYTELAVSDKAFAIYNDTDAAFYDLSATPLFIAEMDSPITDVVVGNSAAGVLVTQKEQISSSSYLYIYDMNGNELSQIDFTAKHVMKLGFYGSGDTIYALTLDTSGVVPTCYITTYKTDGTITGSISINTQIIDNLIISDTDLFASGTSSLLKYSYFGETEGELLIYGWAPYDSYVSGSNVLMLYKARSSQTLDDDVLYNVKVIDANLSETMIYFPEGLDYACCSDSRVYAFSDMSIYIYDTSGVLTKTIDLTTPLTDVKKLSNGYAVCWDRDSSYILKLS